MLILQRDGVLLGDDGLVDAGPWTSLQALARACQALEQGRAQQAAQARAQHRQARVRAIRRGHRAGMALSARRHVALSAALASATATLREELAALVDQRFQQLVEAYAPEQWLRPELQRCLAAATPPLLSIRVAAENLDAVRAWADELCVGATAARPLEVMADASLGRMCCVVETATGVIHGRLGAQLGAVRQGLRDAATQRVDTLCARWREPA